MVLVVIAGVASVVLFAMGRVLPAIGVLAAVVALDFVVLIFVRRCLVCYRCRSEFRDVKIGTGHGGYDLAVGEKYRVGE
jgi:membrane protein YdbS with pleckstrin-like domain